MYFSTGAQLQAALNALPAAKKGSFLAFDALYYQQTYMGAAASGVTPIEHFVTIGAPSGAKPNATFDPEFYKASYADLRGTSMDSADLLYHFMTYGLDEGRAPNAQLATFDGTAYLAANPAVAAYVNAHLADFNGSATNGAIAHYVKFGMEQGFQPVFNTNTFTLTNAGDTATANVFNSNPAYTPGGNDLINTLQDEDVLTGSGTNPTLNVVLGAANDAGESMITPMLNGIETVNVQITGDNISGINFQDATGLETLNLTRLTANNAEIAFEDLDATVTNLGVANATRDGDVTFEYREDVLDGTDDELNLSLNNVRLNDLNLQEGGDSSEDEGYFFETVNVTVDGGANIDYFDLQANGREGTEQSLNFVVNDNLEINDLDAYGIEHMSVVANADVMIADDEDNVLSSHNDGITTGQLRDLTITGAGDVTIDGLDGNTTLGVDVIAGTMTGDLTLGVTSGIAAAAGTSVTSGSGNDEIETYGDLAGDIATNVGNDEVTVDGDMAGTASIDAGEGNNTVVAVDMGVTDDDQDVVSNTGYDDVTAASIVTGSGTDSVTVRDLMSEQDWDNKSLTDGNADDLFKMIGATISTGAGIDTVALRTVAEGASVDTGADNDTLNVSINPLEAGRTSFSPSTHTVLAGDTDADQQTVKTTSNTGTREVTSAEVADRLGAVVDMGAGTNDVANFAEASSIGANVVTIVGRDAELRGAETVNVTALDRVNVTTNTAMADQDALTAAVQTDVNANVIGTQTLNLTIANQIDEETASDSGLTQNDSYIYNDNAVITADVMRFDNALTAVNLVSQEQTVLLDPATEVYEAGTTTTYTLNNLRAGVALSLLANEATGVIGATSSHSGLDTRRGNLRDDSQLVIDRTDGSVNDFVANTNQGVDAADVTLNLNYDNARGLNDSAALNVAAGSGAFDLNLNVGATLTDTAATNAAGNNGNVASASDDDQMRIENFAVKFADGESHSIDANGFGDVDFRGDRPAGLGSDLSSDVSSTAATSFTVWSAAGAGKDIAIDAVNADTIAVKNVDGTAVTAANVTLRVNAENNYHVTTGSGNDTFDFRADTVRSDDNKSSVDRADYIDAGAGRDVLIVDGQNSLGNNNLASTFPLPANVIDDDVFENILSVEEIIVDTKAAAGTQKITLNEAAYEKTGLDTIRFVGAVGAGNQSVQLVVGNDFDVAQANPNANGALHTLVIDALAQTGSMSMLVENKDDDTDQQIVDLDIRMNIATAVQVGGSSLIFQNAGDQNRLVDISLTTAQQNVRTFIGDTDISGGTLDAGDLVVSVGTGSIDSITLVDGGGNESAAGDVYTIGNTWTRDVVDGGTTAFKFDASAILNADANASTGGATITVDAGDGAKLNIKGTQNSDTITGGTLADTISGQAGNDTIDGGLGDDTITGDAGNDTLIGNDGNDSIDGGADNDTITGGLGADALTGGTGADTFIYTAVTESNADTTDSITDFATGVDHLQLAITMSGVTTFDASSYKSNAINLGDGDNSLAGTNAVKVAGDGFYSVAEHQLAIDVNGDGDITSGADYVISSANVINLADINFIVTGTAGDDTITGGSGSDSITLGTGSDTLVFKSLTGTDTIADYVVVDDSIQLSKAVFAGLGAVGALTAAEFVSGAGVVAGGDATDRIAYNTTTGDLYYDADGLGGAAAVLIGQFTGAPALVVGEFSIIA